MPKYYKDLFGDVYYETASHTKFLEIASNALKRYKMDGKSLEEFEEDYGCKIIYDEISGGISGIKFDDENGGESAFYLTYANKK